ncbi:MAG: hypothetical protein AAB568_00025, partial [Patescibacteria group bacterium]
MNTNPNKSKNVTVCELIVGFYLNAPFTLKVDDRGQLAGLDKGYLMVIFKAPASKLDRNSPWVIMVNDTRGHVVGAARDIKNPKNPTQAEMDKLAAAMRKPAQVQVKQTPRGNEFVNVSYPKGRNLSQGYLAVNYYKPNAPVSTPTKDGQKVLWGMESTGTNGTVQVMLIQTKFDVVVDATRPESKPEAKPETPVPATDSN